MKDAKRESGYLDCFNSTKIPDKMLMDSMMIAAAEKKKKDQASKVEKTSTNTTPGNTKPDILTRPDQEKPLDSTMTTKERVPNKLASQSTQPKKPVIEILSSETNYDSMVLERSSTPTTVSLSIELDQVNLLSEINLDISSTEVNITSSSTG